MEVFMNKLNQFFPQGKNNQPTMVGVGNSIDAPEPTRPHYSKKILCFFFFPPLDINMRGILRSFYQKEKKCTCQ